MLGAVIGLGMQWLIPPNKIVKDGTTWRLQQLWGILGSHEAEGGLHSRKRTRTTVKESTMFEVVRKYKTTMLRCLVCATILFNRITIANLGTLRLITPNAAAI
jgi:hypothetical protein